MFDYVIVGGGSAGCVLASRLSEDPDIKVCLLEAGPADTNPFIHMPMGILWMMHSKVLNWNFRTASEPQLNNRKLFWPRGRTLGGCSSSNAMLYTRGHSSDYDAWANLGNAGWSYKDILPYFKRAENHEAGPSKFHGVGGPLNVAQQRNPNILTRTFIQAGIQSGIPHNDDFNGSEQEGVGLYEVTQKNGRRWSTAAGYLRMASGRSNLTVITEAHARRVLFDGSTAVGIEYQRKDHIEEVFAAREVILSAGAIQSPQLLMLSGVGNAPDLETKNIPVVKHLPGVGKNLQDHLDVLVVNKCTQSVSAGFTFKNFLRGAWEIFRYFTAGKGLLTMVGAEGGGFAKTSPQERVPDVQFHFNPLRLSNHGLDLGFLMGDGYSLHVCDLRPKSRGEITLVNNDPMGKAHINANYLSAPEDMERMVKAVKLARKILAAPAFNPYRGEEMRPSLKCQSDEEIRQFIRERAETIYHPVGTCKMGSDSMAVVDDELRVHGLQKLRVVDASIMPLLVGGNTNAPTVMIAEKASEMIKQARRAPQRANVSAPVSQATSEHKRTLEELEIA
jgi:choline dehydrogenase